MNSMFQECNKLNNLDLNFDTSNVTDMAFMFNNCNELKEIKGINKFNTSKVTNMSGMFQECHKLKNLDINFDCSNTTDMECMFNECYELKEIKGINKFNTCKVENLRQMFQDCGSLEYLDLSNFNTSNVTNMASMFNECNKLEKIKITNNFITMTIFNII